MNVPHLLGLFFVGPDVSRAPQTVLDPAGPQAAGPYHLWLMFLCFFVVVWIVLMAFLLIGLLRRRDQKEKPGNSGERAVGYAAAFVAVCVLIFTVVSSVVGRELDLNQSSGNALNIQVTGHQWWWEFQYQNSNPSLGVITANEIHIPVGRPVRVKVSSGDVIHSFWVPNLSKKIDAIPARQNTIVFQANTPGTYRGQCSEFCGLQHANMAFIVVAESPERFQAWLNNQRQDSVENLTSEEKRGKQVFLAAPCVMCHSVRGTEAYGSAGPDLTHVGSRSTLAACTLLNNPANLGGWILDSQRVKPGAQMPPMNIASDDMQPLLAYLEALK